MIINWIYYSSWGLMELVINVIITIILLLLLLLLCKLSSF
jgi:hypothetical protein